MTAGVKESFMNGSGRFFQPWGLQPKNLDFIKSTEILVAGIVMLMGIPQHLVGLYVIHNQSSLEKVLQNNPNLVHYILNNLSPNCSHPFLNHNGTAIGVCELNPWQNKLEFLHEKAQKQDQDFIPDEIGDQSLPQIALTITMILSKIQQSYLHDTSHELISKLPMCWQVILINFAANQAFTEQVI